MKSLLTIIAFVFFISRQFASPLQAQPGQEKVEAQGSLTLGEPQTRTLASGMIHVWSLTLKKGQYVVIEVLQKGIDVVVRIVDPNGTHKREFDSPGGLSGTEKANWITHTTGSWKLEIIASGAKRLGEYEIKWVVLGEATDKDRQIVEADSLHNLADIYNDQGKYTEAEPLYKSSMTIREQVLGAARSWHISLGDCRVLLAY